MPTALFFFLRIALAILSLLCFHIKFRIICSSSRKKVMSNLIRVTLNLEQGAFWWQGAQKGAPSG